MLNVVIPESDPSDDEGEFDGSTGSRFDHQVTVVLQKIQADRSSQHMLAQGVASQASMQADILGDDFSAQ